MWPNKQKTADLVIFSKEILNGTLQFLCSVNAGGSQGGQVLFLTDNYGKCNLISWQLKRIKRITHSTLAAEATAMIQL